ncbi:hypothetical protein RHSIM_Rhsim01G0230100 [Rhododendron simsii]|uniref:Uncharacterized protein n=1 Tax=Rhododendron simsii TaxID=118357 RepID=A0A834LX58_RHOSS|nr:hypothetical protein RHSIM_Rhsim01G0230100 [Rhododendron simsii]
MDPNIPNQCWTLPNGEYVESWSPSTLFTDGDYSGHPGSFSQEYSHEDITTQLASCFTNPQPSGDMPYYEEVTSIVGALPMSMSSGSLLDICNNSQATHQLVVGSSSPASGPQPAETDILCPNVEGRTYHMKYTLQDVENLINGVEKSKRQHRLTGGVFGHDWVVQDKWRNMVKLADTEADPILKELYMRAKNIDADLRKNKKKKNNFSL